MSCHLCSVGTAKPHHVIQHHSKKNMDLEVTPQPQQWLCEFDVLRLWTNDFTSLSFSFYITIGKRISYREGMRFT